MTKLIGPDPNQVPSNADLGNMAYQDKRNVRIDRLAVKMGQQNANADPDNPALLIAHDGHGLGLDYVGATLPSQAGIYTSGTAHTQTAYGDLNIKARTDYGGYYGIGFFTASSNNTPVRRAYFNSTGNLVFESGKGIDFSATSDGTGSVSSEILDDYEEGSWTPGLGGSSGDPTVSYSIQKGRYTKIGNTVLCTVDLRWNSQSGGSGNLNITNLPYVMGDAYCGGVVFEHSSSFAYASGRTTLTYEGNQGASTIVFLQCGSGLSTAGYAATSLGTGSGYAIFSFVYRTT